MIVETTDTRTPLRCTRATTERKSPSPENSTSMVEMRRELHGVHSQLDVHVALDLAAAHRVRELARGLVTTVKPL